MKTELYDGTQDLRGSIVRFTAPWCAPCRAYAPTFDAAVEGRDIPAYAVDIDKHGSVAEYYGVMSVPTTLLINKHGEAAAGAQGILNAETLNEVLSHA